MNAYQHQDSRQTLADAIAEYHAAHPGLADVRDMSPQGREFFRCHDAAHVVFGCGVDLGDEAVVKLSSMLGTTAGFGVLRGYRLHESIRLYRQLAAGPVLTTILRSVVIVPRTALRCLRQRSRWPWAAFGPYLAVPLQDIRREFGIVVPHGSPAVPVKACPLPSAALLNTYRRDGAYVDCYRTAIGRRASHAQYVEAFYTTALFKAERLVLKWAAGRPSTDADARALAVGAADAFAAWTVEGREENQLLLRDLSGRTRSWLMVEPTDTRDRTLLYFGSAVVPARNARTGRMEMGSGFSALLGLHKLYSTALLRAARARLQAQPM